MDVATLTIPREVAEAKLAEYREGLKHRADADYERAAKAYEAALKGKPLLILSQVIAHAPRDEKLRPRLAIARADQNQVKYERRRDGNDETFTTQMGWRSREAEGRVLRVLTIAGITPDLPQDNSGWSREGYALVPMVPPGVRGNRSLATHFVLWEVETWADRVIRAVPDRDPYLLRQVGIDLYAVVGEWALTDIERAIMQDRARA